MRSERWSWPSVVVGTLVLLLLAGGVVGVAAVQPGADAGRTVLAAGEGVGLAPDATTSTTTPAPPTTGAQTTTTVARPARATTTSTSPAARPAPATGATEPAVRSTSKNYFGKSTPTGVEFPYTAGRTTWTGGDNGITITLRMSTASPRVGEPVDFEVEVDAAGKPCCEAMLWFGDGYQQHLGTPCGEPVAAAGPARFRASHTYNGDGRWAVGVQAVLKQCSAFVTTHLFATIEVAKGTSTAQGPSLPKVMIDSTPLPPALAADTAWASIAGLVSEEDGWIAGVTLDWGDGSPPQALSRNLGPMTCQPTPAGWPVPNQMVIFTGDAMHHYGAPGPYRITVRAVSTGCDGSSAPQEATGTVLWVVVPS